jgi:hypothetical protein
MHQARSSQFDFSPAPALGLLPAPASDIDPSQLSDAMLLSRTRELAVQEKKLTSQLLHHLLEIDSRKLYLEQGYPSLFAYVTHALHYSEASAQRRIDAARLLRQVPTLTTKLESGELTLGSVGKAQQYFRAEQKRGLRLSADQKAGVLESLSGLSSREAESKLSASNPEAFRQERIRMTASSDIVITFTASLELQKRLERVRQVHSHVDPSMNYAEMLSMLAEFYLKHRDPDQRDARAVARAERTQAKAAPLPQRRSDASRIPAAAEAPLGSQSGAMKAGAASNPRERSQGARPRRPIPEAIQREVRQRDGNRCVWRMPGGKLCGSRWQVELDHIHEHAQGGEDTAENLRCVCRAHNSFAAQRRFGRRGLPDESEGIFVDPTQRHRCRAQKGDVFR